MSLQNDSFTLFLPEPLWNKKRPMLTRNIAVLGTLSCSISFSNFFEVDLILFKQ